MSALSTRPCSFVDAEAIVFDEEGHIRTLSEIEARVIDLALTKYRNPGEVHRRLGIGRSTLYRKMRELGLGYVG